MSRSSKTSIAESQCPCGSPATYARCCGVHHHGTPAPTPEAVMRSRYTAYALGLNDYLLATWHPSTRPPSLAHDGPAPKWISLQVIAHALQDETHGTVEFIARCRIGGRAERMHEVSRFVCEDGRWFYVDGDSGLRDRADFPVRRD